MPLRVHAHVSYYDDQQYHFRKPQFSTAQRVCEGTYKGTFSSGPTYTCSNIPS